MFAKNFRSPHIELPYKLHKCYVTWRDKPPVLRHTTQRNGFGHLKYKTQFCSELRGYGKVVDISLTLLTHTSPPNHPLQGGQTGQAPDRSYLLSSRSITGQEHMGHFFPSLNRYLSLPFASVIRSLWLHVAL